VYIPIHMTTAITQDLIDPFTPRIEELLRERDAARGASRPVVVLLCDLFIYLMRRMAAIAERNRNGELPATAMAAAPDQPEINEPIAGAPCEMSPCEEPGAKPPAGLPLPRRVCARKLKILAVQAPAQPQHVDHGCWPPWRGAGVFLDCGSWVFGDRFEETSFNGRGYVCSFCYDLAIMAGCCRE
jgi:hypothetical protein